MRKNTVIDMFIPEKLLGCGSDGIVVLCKLKIDNILSPSTINNMENSTTFAVKIMFNNQEAQMDLFGFHLNVVQHVMLFSGIPLFEIPNSFSKFFPENYFSKHVKCIFFLVFFPQTYFILLF